MGGECDKCHEHCLDCVCDKLCDNHITDHKCKRDYKQEWLDFSPEIRAQVMRGLSQEPKHRPGPFSQGEWISVKDGLPDQFDHVLVCDGSSVVSGFYQDRYFVGLSIEVGVVTHWMPLPKPPEA